MDFYSRRPQDVVGNSATMLAYWDNMPDNAKQYLLASPVSIATLGELALMNEQLRYMSDEPPAVF